MASNSFPPKYETLDYLRKLYVLNNEYYFNSIQYSEIFGTFPDIFMKIGNKLTLAKTIRCPRCGKLGQIKEKTTVTKKKYRYMYLYVYHNAYDQARAAGKLNETTNFRKYWCLLNKDYQSLPSVQDAIQKLEHWQDIEKYFYKSLFLYQAEKFENLSDDFLAKYKQSLEIELQKITDLQRQRKETRSSL